jgi:hypothetical protein
MGHDDEAPTATRLPLPEGYPDGGDNAEPLPWSWAEDRLTQTRNVWLATTRPDGRPHAAPIRGIWADGALYFDGFPTARWARNMAANSAVLVHLESGDEVLILEGVGEDAGSIADADLAARIVAAWDAKYGELTPDPAGRGMYRFRPRAARGWSRFPHDATRWRFPGPGSSPSGA